MSPETPREAHPLLPVAVDALARLENVSNVFALIWKALYGGPQPEPKTRERPQNVQAALLRIKEEAKYLNEFATQLQKHISTDEEVA